MARRLSYNILARFKGHYWVHNYPAVHRMDGNFATLHLSLFNVSDEKIYPDAALWARDHLPSNSLIVCSAFSGAIYYYTDLPIVRFEGFADGKAKAFLEMAFDQKRPIYAILWPYEVKDAQGLMGGNWKTITEIGWQKIAVLQFVR